MKKKITSAVRIKAQKIRITARKIYEFTRAEILKESEVKFDAAYSSYCDVLDAADKMEGKPKVKR